MFPCVELLVICHNVDVDVYLANKNILFFLPFRSEAPLCICLSFIQSLTHLLTHSLLTKVTYASFFLSYSHIHSLRFYFVCLISFILSYLNVIFSILKLNKLVILLTIFHFSTCRFSVYRSVCLIVDIFFCLSDCRYIFLSVCLKLLSARLIPNLSITSIL